MQCYDSSHLISNGAPNMSNTAKYTKYSILCEYLGASDMVKCGVPEKIIQNPKVFGGILYNAHVTIIAEILAAPATPWL